MPSGERMLLGGQKCKVKFSFIHLISFNFISSHITTGYILYLNNLKTKSDLEAGFIVQSLAPPS